MSPATPCTPASDTSAGPSLTNAIEPTINATTPALRMAAASQAHTREGHSAAAVRLEDAGDGVGVSAVGGRKAGGLDETRGEGSTDEPNRDAMREGGNCDARGALEEGSDRLLLDWLMLHKVRA